MLKLSLKSLSAVALAALLSACQTTAERPVLYPNSRLTAVGNEQAQTDIDACMDSATKYGVATNKDGQAGKRAAQGAAIGAVSSAAWGLVRGDDVGEYAAAGAAAGLAGGATSGAIESSQTNPAYKTFVQKCLAEQGYEIIGWQ